MINHQSDRTIMNELGIGDDLYFYTLFLLWIDMYEGGLRKSSDLCPTEEEWALTEVIQSLSRLAYQTDQLA